MKKYLIFLALVTAGNFLGAQDLIVTKSNDSIKCKITDVKKDYLYFIFKKDNSFQSTLIEKSKVLDYTKDYFPEDSIPKDSLPGYEKYPRHLIGINGGYSYDPVQIQSGFLLGFDEYTNNLRSGFHFEGNYTYYYQKKFGVGLRLNYYQTKASQNNVNGTDGSDNSITATLSNDISVFFIGPSSTIRFLNKNQKNAFILNASIGYASYKDTYKYVNQTITSASGVGVVSSIGYDFGLNKNLSLGIQLGATALLSDKIKIDNGSNVIETKLSDNERLIGSARLDFSVGLRYSL